MWLKSKLLETTLFLGLAFNEGDAYFLSLTALPSWIQIPISDSWGNLLPLGSDATSLSPLGYPIPQG